MINNISIATVYDVISLRDDVSIYSVDLFKEIVTLNTVSVGKRNAIISGCDFFSHNLFYVLGTHSLSFMATECTYVVTPHLNPTRRFRCGVTTYVFDEK